MDRKCNIESVGTSIESVGASIEHGIGSGKEVFRTVVEMSVRKALVGECGKLQLLQRLHVWEYCLHDNAIRVCANHACIEEHGEVDMFDTPSPF